MIALCNFFDSYENVKIESSNNDIFENALRDWTEYSYANLSLLAFPLFFVHPVLGVLALPITVYDQCEVYSGNKCVGYYDLNEINKANHSVSYNLRLFDQSVLPKNFDFHFEKFNTSEKSRKCFLSGLRVFFDKKMIIDEKY